MLLLLTPHFLRLLDGGIPRLRRRLQHPADTICSQRQAGVLRKTVTIKGLSVRYQPGKSSLSMAEHSRAGVSPAAFDGWAEAVLQPADVELRIAKHSSTDQRRPDVGRGGGVDDDSPATAVEFVCDSIHGRLSEDAMCSLLRIVAVLTDKLRYTTYLQYRPQ